MKKKNDSEALRHNKQPQLESDTDYDAGTNKEVMTEIGKKGKSYEQKNWRHGDVNRQKNTPWQTNGEKGHTETYRSSRGPACELQAAWYGSSYSRLVY